MLRGWLIPVVLLTAVDIVVAEDASPRPPKKPDVGYYATTQDVVDKMLDLAKVTKKDHVCDLGCGDGRFVVTAAKKFGCRSTGYELDPQLVATGRTKIREAGLEKLAKIEEQDIFTADLADTTVVMLFLLPKLNARLVPQLQKMPHGSRIITHEFDIPGIQADQELTWVSKQDDSEHLLYVYTIPLKPMLDKK